MSRTLSTVQCAHKTSKRQSINLFRLLTNFCNVRTFRFCSRIKSAFQSWNWKVWHVFFLYLFFLTIFFMWQKKRDATKIVEIQVNQNSKILLPPGSRFSIPNQHQRENNFNFALFLLSKRKTSRNNGLEFLFIWSFHSNHTQWNFSSSIKIEDAQSSQCWTTVWCEVKSRLEQSTGRTHAPVCSSLK